MKYVIPKHKHEDNIKAELYKWTNKHSLHLNFEYTHENCRFDAVFVRGKEILAIIEIKNWSAAKACKVKGEHTSQITKYLSFGVPVLLLWSNFGIRNLIGRLKQMAVDFDENGHVPKAKLAIYPKPKKKKEDGALAKLIKQQERDMKFGHRSFG